MPFDPILPGNVINLSAYLYLYLRANQDSCHAHLDIKKWLLTYFFAVSFQFTLPLCILMNMYVCAGVRVCVCVSE